MPTLHLTRTVTVILLTGLAALTGCGQYDVTVNERTVYTPTPLLDDFVVEDEALAACLSQTIQDQQVTRINQLRSLRCSSAGIVSLKGLERFSALERLDLSRNAISDLTPLAGLQSLRSLYLRDNQVLSASALMDLAGLDRLDLGGNAGLACPKAGQFSDIATLQLPRHCSD
jgi:hypothetical protein